MSIALHPNGVHADTGDYLTGPDDLADIRALVRGAAPSRGVGAWLAQLVRRRRERPLGLPWGVDARDPAQAGWTIVFSDREEPEVRKALEPLIAHRRATLGADVVQVREHRNGESVAGWLGRHDVFPGAVDPRRVGYYVALIGQPNLIALDFQALLGAEYAPGRICLATPEEYRRYACSVIASERPDAAAPERRAVFFATRHDAATELSCDHLVAHLARHVEATPDDTITEAGATKQAFLAALSRPRAAAVYFTATHGLAYDAGDPRQRNRQGALLCHGWRRGVPASDGVQVAAGDLGDDLCVRGSVLFCFACFSAGSPQHDDTLPPRDPPRVLAPEPFVARLPQALLAHPRGGALAVIGHVNRAWDCSIEPTGAGVQRQPYVTLLEALLGGAPAAYAMGDFRQRYATLSAALLEKLGRVDAGADYADAELLDDWLERNDARNFALIGDPAVRIRY